MIGQGFILLHIKSLLGVICQEDSTAFSHHVRKYFKDFNQEYESFLLLH